VTGWGWVAFGGAFPGTIGLLLCMDRLRLFPLNTTTVIRYVINTAATALRLLPRRRASTG
jgi:hypothetical protein